MDDVAELTDAEKAAIAPALAAMMRWSDITVSTTGDGLMSDQWRAVELELARLCVRTKASMPCTGRCSNQHREIPYECGSCLASARERELEAALAALREAV